MGVKKAGWSRRKKIVFFSLSLFGFILLVSIFNLNGNSARQGVYTNMFGTSGSGEGHINHPDVICVDKLGNVYVADGTSEISLFDGAGNFLRYFANYFTTGLAISDNGSVFIGVMSDDRVQVVDGNGFPLFSFGSYGSSDGCFISIYGIAINKSGFVYVTDPDSYRVQVFTPTGAFVNKWITPGKPSEIAISPQGHIYVALASLHCVVEYTNIGVFVRNISLPSDLGGQEFHPNGLAIDPSGYIYVTDSGLSCVYVFNNKGNFDCMWGTYGYQYGQFNTPEGIAISDQQYIYIADMNNNRIQVFIPQGIIQFWVIFPTITFFMVIVAIKKRKLIIQTVKKLKLKIQSRKYAQFAGTDIEMNFGRSQKPMTELGLQLSNVKQQQKLEMERERQNAERQFYIQETHRAAELERQRREREAQRIPSQKEKIKRTILELAPQFSRLQVYEIIERTGIVDESLIVDTIQEMIERRDIDGIYFRSTKSIALKHQVLEKQAYSTELQSDESPVEIQRQYEYVGGKIRIKLKITNLGKNGLLRVRCMLNIPDSFRLLRVEPNDYSSEGSTLKLQDLLPKEEKSVAFVLEPMICGKEQFSGNISGVNATGLPFALSIKSLEVDVRCPLFANPEDTNLPIVKNMALDLPVKSERVFYLPETFSPASAFEIAKDTILERDVRFVGSITAENRKDTDTFDESAWFYGITKIEKKRYVLTTAVSEKDRVIRLGTACDDEAGCTGFLAEVGAALRRELVHHGAYESEMTVVELICEKCGATLRSAPTIDHDVRCPECQWAWRAKDFYH